MQKIESLQTKEYIANILRNEILSGGIKPGEELAQEKLAELLGVSRMPIREALQTLETEGFIERLPNRHMRVIELNEEKIQEIFHFIAETERMVMDLLLKKAEKDSSVKVQLERLGNLKTETREQELSWHLQLGELLGNDYIRQIYGRLLQGYIAFALLELPREDSQEFEKVKDELKREEYQKLFASLSRYYEKMSHQLINHWKENVDE